MTFKDKNKRPGGKPTGGAKKPYSGPKGKGGEKPAFKQARPPREATASAPAASASGLAPERISKLLARAGVASRRDVERMILEGRVRVNGEVLTGPAVNATYADNIEVDGERIRGPERTRLWLYHKPAGLVTTNADPEGRPTVFENLPDTLPRVMSIGRLDINTEGLLLLTNDGGLARVLELPTTGWLRRYRVRAHGAIDQARLDQLKEGIAVDGVLYGGIEAVLDREQGHNVWITMGLREGKNREIKNVLGALGLDVNRLIRISYGPFQLGNLGEGEVLEVRGRMLRDQLGPRLIEDAKANFDAPIFDHSGEMIVEEEERRPARGKREDRPARDRGEGRPFRDRDGDDRRERALGRLGTKPDFKSGDDKPKKKEPPRTTSRSANVWMAPGARPLGEKKAAAQKARIAKYGERDAAKPVTPENTAKPTILRVRDEEGQWIRSSGETKPKREEGGFGGRRDRGDRPSREDRGERRDRSDRAPREDRGDRPQRAERFERSERPARDGDRPAGAKPFGNKSGRSFGDKPGGGKPFGGKPGGGKSFGGKPSGGKPGGGKPFGGKGGKPSGKPGGRTGGKPGGKGGADRRG